MAKEKEDGADAIEKADCDEERENAECNPVELEPNARPRFYPGKTGVLKKERSAGPPRSNQMLPQHAHHQPGINEPEHDPEKKSEAMSTPAKACWGSLAKVDPSDEKALPSCAIARKIPNCKRAAKFFPEERGGLLDNWRAIPAAITGATKVVRAVRIWAAQAASEYRP